MSYDLFSKLVMSTKLADNYFSSNKKGTSILLYSSVRNKPDIDLIVLTYRKGESLEKEKAVRLVEKLSSQTNIPYVSCGYDDEFKSITFNGKEYSPIELAEIFNKNYKIELKKGVNNVKAMNDLSEADDPMMQWGRNAFDDKVTKQDLDGVFFDNNYNIKFFIELKRSDKIKVGSWTPFSRDTNNYLQLVNLSKKMECTPWVLTIHTQLGKFDSMTSDTELDLFIFDNTMTFQDFSSPKNRKKVYARTLLEKFENYK